MTSTEPRWSLAVMTTGSMRPSVCEGDVLLVDRAARPPWATGALLLLPTASLGSKDRVIHRAVVTEERGGRRVVMTRGDVNNFDDPPTPENDVAGLIVALGRDDGGSSPRTGPRALLARLFAPAFSALTVSGNWAAMSRLVSERLSSLRSRGARRALLGAWLAAESLRRAALRESLVSIVAKAGAAGPPR